MLNPVRYPGGKGSKKIVDRILSLYPDKYFYDKTWIEPFCGGCGLGLSLLERGAISKAVFNDADLRIHDMWWMILYNTQDMVSRIRSLEITVDAFKRAKVVANAASSSHEDRGFATYVLDRCARSGYIDGGVIGGNDQLGAYKVDCRFNKETLIPRIEKLGQYCSHGKIELTPCSDAIEIIENRYLYGRNPFLYIDPPYVQMGTACYHQRVDHLQLSETLHSISDNWLLSYDDCQTVRTMYDDCVFNKLYITYSNNSHTRGETPEMLITAAKHSLNS